MGISASAGYTPQLNSAALASAQKPASAAPAKAAPSPQAASSVEVSVVVSLSVQAQAMMSSREPAAASSSPYARYFPTRDGKPATALARAVSDPGAESLSAGKSLADVAKSARASMDAQYDAMEKEGKPFDYNSFEGKDWYSLMGDLDRRALHAVSSNADGLFSKQEQDMAQSIMSQQQGLAMGLYNGPISQEGSFVDPHGGDNAARMKAGVAFLDKVSADEKTSVPWAVNRASAQTSYEWIMSDRDEPTENLDSDVPLAKLLKSAMATMKGDSERGISSGRIETIEDIKQQAWFKGFEDRLGPAIQATRKQLLPDAA
ncbi:hypothetical protein [Azospirillum agricola]|uniref:hypothetical protein n=1 Tax=Azospirillum agricola TaxID=1720247 RepID=UPI000A0F0945|nr:hypothetical protein [Azospirillum agricola]SMH54139.1 hypothetical protein SAMN02982994_3479 [Azospirillum lipoferum]